MSEEKHRAPESAATLDDIRSRIDAVDRELQRLLNERAALCQRVAEVKSREAGDEAPVFYRPEREAQILAQVSAEQ